MAQGHAVNQFHDDVGHSDRCGTAAEGVLARVVHGNDVRVVQCCGTVGLAAEALVEGWVPCQFRTQDLDGDPSSQAQVVRFVNLGHAATTQGVAYLVAVTEHGRAGALHGARWGRGLLRSGGTIAITHDRVRLGPFVIVHVALHHGPLGTSFHHDPNLFGEQACPWSALCDSLPQVRLHHASGDGGSL